MEKGCGCVEEVQNESIKSTLELSRQEMRQPCLAWPVVGSKKKKKKEVSFIDLYVIMTLKIF